LKKRGFTLLELLVVIAIIGILISMLQSSVEQERERVRRAVASSAILDLAEAESIFVDSTGAYGTLEQLIEAELAPPELHDTKLHGYEFTIVLDPLRLADGPDEVHKILIAKNVLKQYHAGGSWDFGN